MTSLNPTLMIAGVMLILSASAWAFLSLLKEFSSFELSYRAIAIAILAAAVFTGLVTWMAVQTGIVTATGIHLP